MSARRGGRATADCHRTGRCHVGAAKQRWQVLIAGTTPVAHAVRRHVTARLACILYAATDADDNSEFFGSDDSARPSLAPLAASQPTGGYNARSPGLCNAQCASGENMRTLNVRKLLCVGVMDSDNSNNPKRWRVGAVFWLLVLSLVPYKSHCLVIGAKPPAVRAVADVEQQRVFPTRKRTINLALSLCSRCCSTHIPRLPRFMRKRGNRQHSSTTSCSRRK